MNPHFDSHGVRLKHFDVGSHEIPIRKIQCPGCSPHDLATGVVHWHPENGITFEIDFPQVTGAMLPRYYRRDQQHVGVGNTGSPSIEPEWTAETSDGLPVRLYETQETPHSSVTYGTGGHDSSSRITGSAVFAEVQFPKKSTLAFWNATLEQRRLFFIGFGTMFWKSKEEISYQRGDSVVTTVRCSLPIQVSPVVEVVSAGSRVGFDEAAWVTVTEDGTDPKSSSYSTLQSFISLLNGRRTCFFWLDRFSGGDTLTRTYFGWQRLRLGDIKDSFTQPLPLRGIVEAFEHGREVVERLPELFGAFIELNDLFEFDWILNPIWTAYHSFLGDRVALASVSLERLATEWHRIKKNNSSAESMATAMKWQDSRVLHVRTALLETLENQCAQQGLTNKDYADVLTVMRKRLGDIHQTPNADRLSQVFSDVGLKVSDVEQKTIGNRNRALHGSRTLDRSKPNFNLEAERFDILRMLVTKAVLAVLKYQGPYINYAGRPPTGNFPIDRLSNHLASPGATSQRKVTDTPAHLE